MIIENVQSQYILLEKLKNTSREPETSKHTPENLSTFDKQIL